MNFKYLAFWAMFPRNPIFAVCPESMKRLATSIYISLFAAVLFLSGCEIFDRPESLPVYVKLNSAKVALNEAGTFTTTLGVKDYWIDYGPDPVGVFRIGSVVPVIPVEGQDSLVLRGGIFETGLSALRSPYPFWSPVIIGFDAGRLLDTLRMDLTFKYYPDTVLAYPFVEDFERASLLLENVASTTNATTLTRTTNNVFMGRESGEIIFDNNRSNMEMISSEFIPLPRSGNNNIYIEITYRNNIPFTAGLYYTSGVEVGEIPAELVFNSDMEWNTVYINVNDGVRALPSGTAFKLYLRGSGIDANTGLPRNGVIYLDNIRIVHFK